MCIFLMSASSDLGEGSSRGGGRDRRRSPSRERQKSRGRRRSRSRRSMVRRRSGSQDLHTEIGVSLATKEFQDKQSTRGRSPAPYVKEKRRWGSRERRSQSREKWFKFFSFKKDGVVEKEQEMKKIKKRQEGAARKLHPEEFEQSSSRAEYCGRDVRGSSREVRRRSRSKDGRLFDVRQEDERRRDQDASRIEEAKRRILHIEEAQRRDLEEGRRRSEEQRRSRDRSRSSSEEGGRSRSREGTKINYTSNFSSILRKREEEAEAREASRERRRQRGRRSRSRESRSRTPSPSSCARLPPHLLGGWVPTG